MTQILVDQRIDLTAPFTIKAAKNMPYGQIEVVVSNSGVDRHGESIQMSGIDTKQIMRNPVVLWAHDYESLPIGKIEKLWKSGDNLMAKVQFMTDIVPFAETVYKLILAGALNAVSIGGMVKQYGVEGNKTDYAKIDKLEMVELSVVPVGAHPDALVTSKTLEKTKVSEEELNERYAEFQKTAKMAAKDVDGLLQKHIRPLKDLLSALEHIGESSNKTTQDTPTKTIRRKKLVLSESRQVAKTMNSQIDTLIGELNNQLKGIHNERRRKQD